MKHYVIYHTRAKNAKNHIHRSFERTVYFESIEQAIRDTHFFNEKYDLEIRTAKHEVVARRIKGEWEVLS